MLMLFNLFLVACGGATATTSGQIVPTATPTLRQTATVAPTRTVQPTATRAVQATPTPIVLPTSTPLPPSPTPTPPPPNFDENVAFKHLQVLVNDIGVREAGTPNHEKAGDFIENYFRSLKLQTQRPLSSFDSLIDRGSGLKLTANGQTEQIKGSSLRFSTNIKVTAPLAKAGQALNGSLTAGSLQGKIALIERGGITFADKAKNAKAAGAIAVIIYNNQAGELNGTLGSDVGMPVIGVNQAEGQKLLVFADQNAMVEFTVDIAVEKRNFSNVVGIRPALTPKSPNPPVLIIGGHYDSVPAGPGANDNASGTVIVMELARVMQTKYPDVELRFIAFGAEEFGLYGSADYVKNLSQAERARVKAMLNIDMVAVGNTLYFGGNNTLVQLAFAGASEVGAGDVQAMPNSLVNGSSDHAPFAQAGISVLFFYRGEDPNYHQPTDTSDKIIPSRLGLVGNIVIKVIDSYVIN